MLPSEFCVIQYRVSSKPGTYTYVCMYQVARAIVPIWWKALERLLLAAEWEPRGSRLIVDKCHSRKLRLYFGFKIIPFGNVSWLPRAYPRDLRENVAGSETDGRSSTLPICGELQLRVAEGFEKCGFNSFRLFVGKVFSNLPCTLNTCRCYWKFELLYGLLKFRGVPLMYIII